MIPTTPFPQMTREQAVSLDDRAEMPYFAQQWVGADNKPKYQITIRALGVDHKRDAFRAAQVRARDGSMSTDRSGGVLLARRTSPWRRFMDGITLSSKTSITSSRPSVVMPPPAPAMGLPPSLRLLDSLTYQTTMLVNQARLIAMRRKVTVASLASLPIDDLFDEIALERWVMICEQARAVYALPEKDRKKEMRRLSASRDEEDRYVAMLAKRWMTNRG
jgi:hypothetical protein